MLRRVSLSMCHLRFTSSYELKSSTIRVVDIVGSTGSTMCTMLLFISLASTSTSVTASSSVIPTGEICNPSDTCADGATCLTRCCTQWVPTANCAACNAGGNCGQCVAGSEWSTGFGCVEGNKRSGLGVIQTCRKR